METANKGEAKMLTFKKVDGIGGGQLTKVYQAGKCVGHISERLGRFYFLHIDHTFKSRIFCHSMEEAMSKAIEGLS